ncbi:MAG: hypothetical protein HYY16_10005 [Planctomycetes bacterium]|nr:hypothetical protein [Planctomycetota bacterium]
MAVPKDLIEIMACPLCKADVRHRPEPEAILCTRPECGLVFRVQDDIPVMLIEEAQRPCPGCGAQREWDEKNEAVRCAKCGTAYRYERK